MDLTELAHHLQLAGAFVGAVVVSHHDQPLASVRGQDVVLDVRHELDDAGALGGLVHLKEAIALQAVRYSSEQSESFASCLGGRDLEALAPVPPCPLLHEASTDEVIVNECEPHHRLLLSEGKTMLAVKLR